MDLPPPSWAWEDVGADPPSTLPPPELGPRGLALLISHFCSMITNAVAATTIIPDANISFTTSTAISGPKWSYDFNNIITSRTYIIVCSKIKAVREKTRSGKCYSRWVTRGARDKSGSSSGSGRWV